MQLLQPAAATALLLGQGQEFLAQALQFPFLLLQGLALLGELGLGFIAGAAPLTKAGLQLLLLGLEGAALLLIGLLLLLPLGALSDQGIDGLGEPLLFPAQGLELAAYPLGGQSPLPAGGQQVVAFLSGLGQGGIGGLELLLQALPALAVAAGLGAGFIGL